MNYSSFLNKNTKIESNQHYNVENKKKKSHFFLFSSLLSIAVLAIFITFFTDTDRSLTTDTYTASSDTILPPFKTHSSTHNSTLKLPEVSSHSDVLSNTVVYSEAPAAEIKKPVNKPATDNISTIELTQMVATQEINLPTEESLPKSSVSQNTITPIVKQAETPAVVQKKSTTDKIVSPQTQELIAAEVNESITTKTVVVKKGDTLSAIFKRLSLSGSTLHKIINSSKQAKRLTKIKPGQALVFTLDNTNKFKSLQYDLDMVDSLTVEKISGSKQFVVRIDSKEIEIRQQFAVGIITSSLFSAGNKAGLSNAMTMKLAQLFGWDVDFALDIRKGDTFAVLFEEKYINDKKIGNGNILSAEFVNKGKVFTAIRYTDAANHTDYYSAEGLSMRKAFLRTPVDFSRISSRFSSGRKHPVLNRIRAHKGVDYAAARGTPIKAVGDGKVIFKGTKGGYGRVIILQHGAKYSTLYAHMNSYNKKMRKGTRVKQGQVIGYVGSSGLATGPHLHYEFRMNGVHRNPLTVALPSASPIAKKYRNDFQSTAETMISQLKLRKQDTIALAEQ